MEQWHVDLGIHQAQISKGIHIGFKTRGRRHQKFETGAPVAPQKRLMLFTNFKRGRIQDSL